MHIFIILSLYNDSCDIGLLAVYLLGTTTTVYVISRIQSYHSVPKPPADEANQMKKIYNHQFIISITFYCDSTLNNRLY
jgi:hypothetical protein